MNIETTLAWSDCETPLGKLTLTATSQGLDGLFFPDRAPNLDEADRRPELFVGVAEQLDEYFAGTRQRFELELDLSAGTPFQRAVWDELQLIPYGETVAYGELATRMGRPDRVRAVGGAAGRNPLPIIVPCHRVIGADGRLTGYLGGLERKRALLDGEGAAARSNGAGMTFGTAQLALL